MTVTSQTSRNDYSGNGVTTAFPVTFRFLQNSHLRVIRTVVATGEATTLTLDAGGANGYTVTGAGQPNGGTVYTNVAVAVGERISILRNVPITQEVDYLANDPFPAETHEQALDKLTMIVQQQGERIGRSLTLPPQSVGISTELDELAPLDNIRLNAAGDKLEGYQLTPYGDVGGSNLIGFLQAGSGAVLRTVQDKLREVVSPDDFASFAEAAAAATGKPFNLLNGGLGGSPFINEIPAGKIRVIAGTIRQNTPPNQSSWSFIADAAHVPVGFRTSPADISANAANLVLTFPEVFKRVITLVVVPDETLASQWGLQCGSSVSLDSIAINMSISREVGGRVWFDGTTWQHKIQSMGQTDVDGNTPSFSAGNLTIGHPYTPGSPNNPIMVCPSTNNGAVVPLRPAHKLAPSDSAFVVNFIDDAGTGLVTTASTRMSLVYKKSFIGPIRVDNTGASADLPLYQGNLWLFGIMEAE